MPSSDHIQAYIRKHPSKSDKAVAQKFRIDQSTVKNIRAQMLYGVSASPISAASRETKDHFSVGLDDMLSAGRVFFDNALGSRFIRCLILFFLAAGVRVAYLAGFTRHDFLRIPILDAEYYLDLGKNIISGWSPDHGVYFTEPFYGYLIAFFLKWTPFGHNGVIGLQMFLGCLLPCVVLLLGEKVLNRPIAFLAGILTALYGPFIFYESLLLKTSLEVFFLPVNVLLLVHVLSTDRKRLYFAAGLSFGILTVIKANNLLLVPVILFLIVRKAALTQRQKLTLTALFSIGFALVIAPITLRNYVVGKDKVLLNYSMGMNLYHGNYIGTDGSLLQPRFMRPHPAHEETDSYKMAEAFAGKPLKPSEVSSFWARKAFAEIRKDPVRWFKLLGKKCLMFLTHRELSDNYVYGIYQQFVGVLRFLPGFWFVAALGMTGMLLLLFSGDFRAAVRRPTSEWRHVDTGQQLMLWMVGCYVASLLLFHVNARYRMPVVVFFHLSSAAAVWYLFDLLRKGRKAAAGGVGVLAAAFLLISSVHLRNFDFNNNADFYNNIGSVYLKKKDYARAQEYFEKAIQAESRYYWAYNNLFRIHLRVGEFDRARQYLQAAVKLRPDDMGVYKNIALLKELDGKSIDVIQQRLDAEEAEAGDGVGKNAYDPYFYEGMRCLEGGDYACAEKFFEQSAEKFGDSENTLVNLAVIKKAKGDRAGAKKLLTKVIDKNPEFLVAQYNLANIYLGDKSYAEAAGLLQGVYNSFPEFGEAWYYLGLAYMKSGNAAAAEPVLRAFVSRYSGDPAKQAQVQQCAVWLSPRAVAGSNP